MSDEKHRELYRLNIAKWDIDAAVIFFKAALDHNPTSIEYEALIISGIIHYARPFSINERGKESNALARVPERVVQHLSEDERVLHERLLNRRNKAIAHSEWKEFPVGIDLDTRVMSSKRYSIYPEFLDVRPLIELTERLLTRLHNMVADHVSQLSRENS